MPDTSIDAVFVVGSIRTGTGLMSRLLDRTDEIAVCDETHFLGTIPTPGYLRRTQRIGDLSRDEDVERIVDYLFGLRVYQYRWLAENIDKDEFIKRLLEGDRSPRSLFDLILRTYARGKPIVGEKTPGHLAHVPTLLKWYPGARIIHTFRDPRAVFVSELNKKERPGLRGVRYRLTQMTHAALMRATVDWTRAAVLHQRYQRQYPGNYRLVRFEDLMEDPRRELDGLSRWLGVRIGNEILEDLQSNSSFVAGEWQGGIDRGAGDRWREHLPLWADRWFKLVESIAPKV